MYGGILRNITKSLGRNAKPAVTRADVLRPPSLSKDRQYFTGREHIYNKVTPQDRQNMKDFLEYVDSGQHRVGDMSDLDRYYKETPIMDITRPLGIKIQNDYSGPSGGPMDKYANDIRKLLWEMDKRDGIL